MTAVSPGMIVTSTSITETTEIWLQCDLSVNGSPLPRKISSADRMMDLLKPQSGPSVKELFPFQRSAHQCQSAMTIERKFHQCSLDSWSHKFPGFSRSGMRNARAPSKNGKEKSPLISSSTVIGMAKRPNRPHRVRLPRVTG